MESGTQQDETDRLRRALAEKEQEIARLKNEHLAHSAQVEAASRDEARTREALLFMLEDLEENRRQIEQAKREWSIAFDAVRDPVFIHDRNYRILRVNRAYAERAGRAFDDIIGKCYWEVFPRHDGPLSGCRQAMGKGDGSAGCEGTEGTEEELTLETGEVFLSRAFAMHEPGGDYVGSIHVLEDITGKKRAEAERHLLSEALRQSAAGLVLLDADLVFRYANQAACQLVGWGFGQLDGRPLATVVPESTRDSMPAVLAAVNATGAWNGEVALLAQDDSLIPAHLAAAAVRDEQGKIVAHVGSWLDLRPIKEAQQALHDSEETFRGINTAAQDAMMLIDNDGKLLYWNPAAERILGYRADDVLGREMHRLIAPARYLPAYEQGFATFRASGEGPIIGKTLELVAVHRDGHEIPVELSISALKLKGRWGAVGILRDITERKRAEMALRQANRALRALSACNNVLIHAEQEGNLLTDMCRVIVEQGGYRLIWIGLVEHDAAQSVRPVAHAGVDEGYLEALQITWADTERGRGPTGRAVRSGMPQASRNIQADPQYAPWREQARKRGYSSSISMPLKEEDGEVFGVLNVYAAETDAFDDEELLLLTELADDLAFGMLTLRTRTERDHLQEEHLRSVDHLKQTLTDTIRAIALTVEQRDPYTAGHQQRVAELCFVIGRELGLDTDRLEGLRLGATIHDIGKIYVPAEILNRPGRLSAPEFEMIKTHPQVGYDIIKDVKFPWPVGDMILQHHERLNGSGYPRGLKGDDIILEARILAVADVVEAMSSHRPYRPSVGMEPALEEITRHRGALYDPAVVDACLRLFREQGFKLSGLSV